MDTRVEIIGGIDMDKTEIWIEAVEQYSCKTPGKKIRSKGKGRGLAKGKGKGPIGVPIGKKKDNKKKRPRRNR